MTISPQQESPTFAVETCDVLDPNAPWTGSNLEPRGAPTRVLLDSAIDEHMLSRLLAAAVGDEVVVYNGAGTLARWTRLS